MAIVTVSTSNTFNEWRVVTNQLVTEVNKTESGTAALSVDTLTANTVTANGDIAVNGGDLTTTSATFNVANSTATTVNVGGAATTLNLGAATGTTTIRNDASVSGNTTIGGTLGVTGNVTLSGELRGPSTFTIDPAVVGDDTGTVVIKGNLQVDGTTTTINSTTLTVDDKNIVIASGAADAAAANGAGITIDGASATITYLSSGDKFSINKAVDLTNTLSVTSNSTLTGTTVVGSGTPSTYRTLNVLGSQSIERYGATPQLAVRGGTDSSTGNEVRLNVTQTSFGLSANTIGGTQDSWITADLSNPDLRLFARGNEGLRISPSEVVVNDNSDDRDFRVESDTNTHAFFVDAGNSRVGINQSSPSTQLHIGGTSTTTSEMTLAGEYQSSTFTNSNIFNFQHGNSVRSRIRSQQVSAASDNFLLDLDMVNGSLSGYNNFLRVRGTASDVGGEVVINDGGLAEIDFRVESDNNAYMLWVDASADGINIGGSDTIQGQLNIINNTGNDVASTTSLYITTGQTYGTAANKKNLDLVFQGYRDGAGTGAGAKARIRAIEQTGNSRLGTLQITTLDSSGNLQNNIELVSTEVCINQDGVDMDFRVESDNSTHMLFVDAGEDVVKIGSTTAKGTGNRLIVGPGNTNANTVLIINTEDQNYNGLSISNWDGATTTYGPRIAFDNSGHGGFTIGMGDARNSFDLCSTWGTPLLRLTPSAAIFNEDGADVDFRVESDNYPHMLFVDAGNDVVSIGTSSVLNWYQRALQGPSWAITELLGVDQTGFSTGCYQDAYGFESNWKFAGAYPATLYTQSGDHNFWATSSTRTANGAIVWKQNLTVSDTVVVVNEGSNDVDFRVESDTDTHCIFVDASTNTVGIGTSTPNTYGGKLAVGGHIMPTADNTYDLGSASYSWANVYTGDLHLSNMKKETGNEIDGTKGDWTIQEGENDLFILNNRTGKKYKFKLEEIQ